VLLKPNIRPFTCFFVRTPARTVEDAREEETREERATTAIRPPLVSDSDQAVASAISCRLRDRLHDCAHERKEESRLWRTATLPVAHS